MATKNDIRRRGRKAKPNTDGTRMCAACRMRAPRGQMARFVVDGHGQLFYDRHGKAPGRGVHLCYRRSCIDNALKTKAFGRSLRTAVKAHSSDAIVEMVRQGIEARIEDGLRIGGRAKWIVSGTDVLMRSAAKVVLMIIAEDVAENTVNRLGRVVGGGHENVVRYGSASFLGETQGKEPRVALGVTNLGWADSLKDEFARRMGVLVVQSVESR
ncbi:MAG: DUF448 domain-containing protein [Myxococcota bacterium]|nr:DUF448 domain-containing protein [Myxococcota bacterium]